MTALAAPTVPQVFVFDGDRDHPRPSPERVAGRLGALDQHVHVRRAALPAPGDELDLFEWVADQAWHEWPEDRVVVLEGLLGGRWALVSGPVADVRELADDPDAGIVRLFGAPLCAVVGLGTEDIAL